MLFDRRPEEAGETCPWIFVLSQGTVVDGSSITMDGSDENSVFSAGARAMCSTTDACGAYTAGDETIYSSTGACGACRRDVLDDGRRRIEAHRWCWRESTIGVGEPDAAAAQVTAGAGATCFPSGESAGAGAMYSTTGAGGRGASNDEPSKLDYTSPFVETGP